MKLLLTSGGIKNKTIYEGLVNLLQKPIEQCRALCISTALYPMSIAPTQTMKFYQGTCETPMCELGWASVGVLELTALPSIEKDTWVKWLENTDVLLVNGGDPLYLSYWMKQSGIADILPSLNIVYVGLSAGSMIMSPCVGEEFVHWKKYVENDETLGYVEFSIFPHLDHIALPENTMENALKWSEKLSHSCYVIDDETAIMVNGDKTIVLSEGKWKKLK
ncbi:MAG: Type 1 glutamine amidotransferase-like domain-containing protein [Candidatus Izemoplasmatales bacterium]